MTENEPETGPRVLVMTPVTRFTEYGMDATGHATRTRPAGTLCEVVSVDGGVGELDAHRLVPEEHKVAEVRANGVYRHQKEGTGERDRGDDADASEGLGVEEAEGEERRVLQVHAVNEVPDVGFAGGVTAQEKESVLGGDALRRGEEQTVHPLASSAEVDVELGGVGVWGDDGIERSNGQSSVVVPPDGDNREHGALLVDDVDFVAKEGGREEHAAILLDAGVRGTELKTAVRTSVQQHSLHVVDVSQLQRHRVLICVEKSVFHYASDDERFPTVVNKTGRG